MFIPYAITKRGSLSIEPRQLMQQRSIVGREKDMEYVIFFYL